MILTEKVATELDVKSGDMITIQEDTGDVKVKLCRYVKTILETICI